MSCGAGETKWWSCIEEDSDSERRQAKGPCATSRDPDCARLTWQKLGDVSLVEERMMSLPGLLFVFDEAVSLAPIAAFPTR